MLVAEELDWAEPGLALVVGAGPPAQREEEHRTT